MLITIDGPAGSGKSSVTQLLSKKLNIIHFNSGSLYRGIAAFALKNNISVEDFDKNKITIPINLRCEFIDGTQHVYVNDNDYTSVLRNNEVSIASSIYAATKMVRKIVDDCQHEFAKHHDFVIEGRDTGSFVFPNADFKFYLDCSLDIRAERRHKEEIAKGKTVTFEEIKQQIAKRDFEDKNRKIAPLVIPNNAYVIDSSKLTPNQVVNKMLKIITQKK